MKTASCIASSICIILMLIPYANASNVCDEILKYGIFDTYNVLDESSQYDLVKSTQCNVKTDYSTVGIDLNLGDPFKMDGKSERQNKDEFCSSSLSTYSKNQTLRKIVKKASPVIASAWSQCVNGIYGTTHRIVPSADPSIFTYEIEFKPISGGDTTTKVQDWSMTNTKGCHEKISSGQVIDSGVVRLQCTRIDIRKPVIATLNVTVGRDHLRTIELLPYREPLPEIHSFSESDFERRPNAWDDANAGCDPAGGPRPVQVPIRQTDGLWNLALLKTTTVSSSSTLRGYPTRHTTDRAADGWYNNCRSWIPANISGGTIKLDFGRSVRIEYFKIGSEHIPSYEDRFITSWTIRADGKQIAHESDVKITGTERINLPAPVVASTIELDISGPHPRLDEIEVYGDHP